MVDSINRDVVYNLAVSSDFTGDKLCFAARHSGLWRSDNGGETWQLIGDVPGVLTGLPATAVAVSPGFRSDGTIFAGMPGGILRSTDGGNSWKAVALSSPPPFVSAIAVSPNYEADGVVCSATLEDGIFRSHDRGETWQPWNFGLFDLNTLSIAISPGVAQDRTVYVGTETGIFCSQNGGRAWQETGFPTDFAPVLSLAMSPKFAQDGILFAGTEAAGVFYSDNRGQTWQHILHGGAINAILLSPDFPEVADVLVVSNNMIQHSCDGGKSWSKRNPSGNPDAEFTTAIAPVGFAQESKLLLGLSNGQVIWAYW